MKAQVPLCASVITLAGILMCGQEPALGTPKVHDEEMHAADARGGLRYTIMVAKFENKANWYPVDAGWDISTAWSELLTSALAEDERFMVIGEKDMRMEAITEQDFNETDRVKEGSRIQAEKGEMTPAQLLVKGTITHVATNTSGGEGGFNLDGIGVGLKQQNAQVNITIYVIDSSTGMVVGSKDVIGKSGKSGLGLRNLPLGGAVNLHKNDNVVSACANAIEDAVECIAKHLEEVRWQGTVVSVNSDRIIVNRGEREGVPVGQKFTVGQAEVIRDPDTGEVLDYDMSPVGTLEVTKVLNKVSYCRPVESYKPIERGMTIFIGS